MNRWEEKKSKATKVQIPTQSGSVVTNNFQNTAAYRFSTVTVLESQPNYAIVFYPKTNSFQITLTETPIQTARNQAEQVFLKDLGVSTTDACKLNVVLDVPYAADPNLSAANYGLSFCPNAIQFNGE